MALPIPPASLTALDAAKGFVYYSTQPVQGLSGPLPGEDPVLHAFDLTERKDKTVIKGISRWWLSHDGSKILYEAKAGGGPRRLWNHRRQARCGRRRSATAR